MDPKPLTIEVVLGFLGGLGGYPQGGLGPQAGRFQGPRAFWAGPRGDPANFSPKTGQNTHIFCTFGGLGGTPRGVWGPRLADSRDPGLPAPVRGADRANFPEKRPKHTFSAVWGSGGYAQGFWGPRLADSRGPGPPGPVRGGDPANFPEKRQFWGSECTSEFLGPQAGRFQGPGASWACPRGRPRR